MRYKHVVYKDALRHEGIWLCTSHSHELLVHNPQAPNYLMTTNISQDYTYPLLVLFAGNARWFAGERLRFVSQPGMFGIEYVRSGDALIKIEDKEILVQPGSVFRPVRWRIRFFSPWVNQFSRPFHISLNRR